MMSVFDRGWFRAMSLASTAGYMSLIFYLSSKPSVPVPPLFPHQDKIFHFIAYFGLAVLLANCTPRNYSLRRRFWLAFSIAAAYGITDEFHQSFVPGRDATIGDWLADAAGGWVGAWFLLRAESWLRRVRLQKP